MLEIQGIIFQRKEIQAKFPHYKKRMNKLQSKRTSFFCQDILQRPVYSSGMAHRSQRLDNILPLSNCKIAFYKPVHMNHYDIWRLDKEKMSHPQVLHNVAATSWKERQKKFFSLASPFFCTSWGFFLSFHRSTTSFPSCSPRCGI